MDEQLKNKLRERLRNTEPEKVVFVGVGNRLRGDDGIGPALIDLIAGQVPHAIDADGAPENTTASIKRLGPAIIVFLDAANFGERPGFAGIVEAGELERLEASVHSFSLDVVMEYLEEATGADVFLVGMQPERVGDFEGTSPSMKGPLSELARALMEAIKKG
jgi:hydrogenase 3 maturation protease